MFNFFLGWSQQSSLIYNIFFKYICSFVFCKTTRTSIQSRHWIQLPSQPTIHHFHKPTTNDHSITTTTTSLHKSQKTTINNHNRPSQLPQPNPSNPQPPIPATTSHHHSCHNQNPKPNNLQPTIPVATTKNPETHNTPSQLPQPKPNHLPLPRPIQPTTPTNHKPTHASPIKPNHNSVEIQPKLETQPHSLKPTHTNPYWWASH